MRVVSVSVGALPPTGSMLCLHYSPPRGGRSSVGHKILPNDSTLNVASELARRINNDRQWCPGYFEARASGAMILIICKDEVADVTIYGDPGVETLKVAEWS